VPRVQVAITGGIAEGKSTVIGYLANLGYTTASADQFAKVLFERPEIQERIGILLGISPPIDRRQLRGAVLTNPAIRREINQLLHAGTYQQIFQSDAQFVEIPLVVETCGCHYFNQVWVVTCGPEEQLKRLIRRVGEPEARQFLGLQLPTEAKIPFADEIIRTNEPEASVISTVRTCLSLRSLDWC
jgi:dephospho-CoA kinase